MQSYDIIIQAGQSNADGSGHGPVACAYEPTPDVWHLNVGKTVIWENVSPSQVIYDEKPFTLAPAGERAGSHGETYSDFSLTFGRDFVDAGLLPSGRRLLIVRAAVGATGFARSDEESGHWGIGEPVYEKMIELIDYAISLSPDNRLVGMLWHQGEHQASDADQTLFIERLTALFLSVRERYGVPALPIVAGDFSQDWKSKHFEDADRVTRAIREVLDRIGHTAFVSSEGLMSNDRKMGNGDDIHFCREALYELGHRYFKAFASIEKSN